MRQERIGIEASISGLRSLTDYIHAQLQDAQANDNGRSSFVAGLLDEVTSSKTSLDAFNYKLSWLHNAPEQAALVKLDQLVILLANAIVLFDRLRTSLGSRIGTNFASDNGLHVFLPQLQEHNMAWKLQLELMDRYGTIRDPQEMMALTLLQTHDRRKRCHCLKPGQCNKQTAPRER